MKAQRVWSVLGGLTVGLACFDAMATTLSSSTEFHINMAVTDLTPNDGVSSGYSISQTDGFGWATSFDGVSSSVDYQPVHASNMEPINVNSSQPGAQASVFGSGVLSLQSSSANIAADALNVMAGATSDNRYLVTVLPYTALTLSGTLSLNISASGDVSSAHALANGIIKFEDRDYYGADSHGFGGISANLGLSPNFPDPGSATHNFSYAFTNNTGRTLYALLNVSTDNSAYIWNPDYVPAVPEPSSYLMLAAGLGLLGMRTVRRLKD